MLVQLGCKKDAIAAQIAAYVLPIASTTDLGGVKVDGTALRRIVETEDDIAL